MSCASRRRARRRTHSRRRLALRVAEVGLGLALLPTPMGPEERHVVRRALDAVRRALREPQLGERA